MWLMTMQSEYPWAMLRLRSWLHLLWPRCLSQVRNRQLSLNRQELSSSEYKLLSFIRSCFTPWKKPGGGCLQLSWVEKEGCSTDPCYDCIKTVQDSNEKKVESQVLPVANVSVGIRNKYVKAYLDKSPSDPPKYWLNFFASVPPLDFNTYTVSATKEISLLLVFFNCNM